MINNNKWAGLSQGEKAQLISIYTKYGYTKLSDIVNHYNRFDNGGEENIEYFDTINPAIITPRISALNQARAKNAEPNTDFSNAQDMSLLSRIKANLALSSLSTVIRKFIGLDPHTCLNTITGFYGANVASNENLVKNPEQYGYKEIQQNELLPGDLILLSNKDNKFTHATMFDSIADRPMIKYDYPVSPGDTLLNYSNGGVGIENYRHEAPLNRFYDSEQSGGDFSGKKKYFRYIGKSQNKYETGGDKVISYNTQLPFKENIMWAPQIEVEKEYKRAPIPMMPYKTEGPIDLESILNRQRYKESTFDDMSYNKKSGAIGAFQITPIVKKQYEDKYGKIGDLTIYENNKKVRDYYMQWLSERPYLQGLTDSVAMAKQLAAYNWGIGNVKKSLEKAKSKGIDIDDSFDWLDEMPQETREYVNFILFNQDINQFVNNEDYMRKLENLK